MDIVNIDISTIKPYEKNPRKNKGAIDKVAASIKEFGFKVPCVVDKDNVLVTGHTRLEAAKKLHIKSVPCVVADDLTEEQIKAFRLADNKVSEFSEWDFDKLDEELFDIADIDMEDFGFEFEDEFEDDEEEEKENERVRTGDAYNLDGYDENKTEGFYQMPLLEPVDHIPTRLIGFNYVLTSKDTEAGVHFYVDDYQFERVWSRPEFYIDKMQDFDCVLTPDFSFYMDMPISMKIWNTYRSRLIGQLMQKAGLTVIPTVSWAEPATYDFCFDGLPEESTLSVSTVGVKNSKEALSVFRDGLKELMKRKQPKRLIFYGGEVEGIDFGDIEVVHISNEVTERMKRCKNGR